MQNLNGLNSQMNNFQNSLDIRIDSIATMTSMDIVFQVLRDMRLEATDDRNAQMDTIRKCIDTQMGCFNPESSQQVLHSIELLDAKIEDQFARSRTSTAQNLAFLSPVLKPHTPVDSGLLFHDQSAMQGVGDQLATQTRLLLLLTERDLRPQSFISLPKENGNDIIQNVQETIKHSIQVTLSFFRTVVDAYLLKLWITLPQTCQQASFLIDLINS
jgi:hypothetical protein